MAYVQKLHRQHTSTVMTIPKPLCKALGLLPGDMVLLEEMEGQAAYRFSKFDLRKVRDGRSKRDSGRGHPGGGT